MSHDYKSKKIADDFDYDYVKYEKEVMNNYQPMDTLKTLDLIYPILAHVGNEKFQGFGKIWKILRRAIEMQFT